ncbi:MAG: ferrochelatase, partial [Steroidobacteraceae bacterium]|nr:ferrochelatase [Steroidobacteraceae bacterium]
MIRRWRRRLLGLALSVLLIGAAGYGVFKYQNRPPQLREPNYYTYYRMQDKTPVGKVGVLIAQLIMPEEYRAADYHNIALKAVQYIPWPVRLFATADRGVVLLDPEKFYEFERFEPKRLVDWHGSERDIDGLRYIDKYRRGEVEWVPPNPRQHLDHGYFLLTTRKQGVPTIAAKLMTKAKVFYHGHGVTNGKLPHEAGMRAIAAASMARIRDKYGPIPWRFVTAEHFGLLREAIDELLATGIDTVILAPAAPIYSHHEEFNGSFRHAIHFIEEWAAQHRRNIKVILAPQLGDFPILRQAFLAMLRERLESLPKGKDIDVKVAVSVHGMPWDFVPHEAWLELAPPYRDGMVADA